MSTGRKNHVFNSTTQFNVKYKLNINVNKLWKATEILVLHFSKLLYIIVANSQVKP